MWMCVLVHLYVWALRYVIGMLGAELKKRFFEDFGGGLCKESTIGPEPVSIIHYTRPGSSIKLPNPNLLAIQRHLNWPIVYPKSSYRIMDPVQCQQPSPKSSKKLRCNSGSEYCKTIVSFHRSYYNYRAVISTVYTLTSSRGNKTQLLIKFLYRLGNLYTF